MCQPRRRRLPAHMPGSYNCFAPKPTCRRGHSVLWRVYPAAPGGQSRLQRTSRKCHQRLSTIIFSAQQYILWCQVARRCDSIYCCSCSERKFLRACERACRGYEVLYFTCLIFLKNFGKCKMKRSTKNEKLIHNTRPTHHA